MKSIDGGAQGTRSTWTCNGSVKTIRSRAPFRGCCEPRTARGPFLAAERGCVSSYCRSLKKRAGAVVI